MIKKCALWLRDSFIRNWSLDTARIVTGSFAAITLIGALLLIPPIASRGRQSTGFFAGLFTATFSTCVTGLILVSTWTQWALFGQAVILTIVQLDGLGFMTIITLVSFTLHRRIGLSERLIMVSTLNLNDMDGVVRVVRHAFIDTFAMETTGAILMSVCLIPEFGFLRGTWHAVFHVVSSFYNADLDLLGGRFGVFSSLAGYNDNPLTLGTITALIVVSDLGFFVWEDVVDERCWSGLSVYGKMVLLITAVLIVGDALFFLMEEFDNPATLGGVPLWQKGLDALFQSVTLRTTGFDSVGQDNLSDTDKTMPCVLMLIGNSFSSTAGGPKTTTMGVLLLALRSGLMGREQVAFRDRAVHCRRVPNIMTLALVVLFVFAFSSIVVSTVENLPYLDSAFEVISAMGTVSLTTGITPALTPFSQGLLILLIYMGHVGILSFFIAFITGNRHPVRTKYPEMNVMIGWSATSGEKEVFST